MKKNSVLNIKGDKVGDITLNETVWGITPNDAVLYDAITLARNSQRQGTHSTKTRSEVSGGGKKVLDVLDKVVLDLHNGQEAELSSDQNQELITKR